MPPVVALTRVSRYERASGESLSQARELCIRESPPWNFSGAAG